MEGRNDNIYWWWGSGSGSVHAVQRGIHDGMSKVTNDDQYKLQVPDS